MYTPDNDLVKIQNIVKADRVILNLLDLSGKPALDIATRIIRQSKWSDLADGDKRLSMFMLPSRGGRSEVIFEEFIEFNCHVPASNRHIAVQVISRCVDVLNNKPIGGRYLRFKGQLGELPTMKDFYCHGCRFSYFSPV